jgi:hypothetical protein
MASHYARTPRTVFIFHFHVVTLFKQYFTGVRPHKCHVCHKGFIARRHLAKHLRIHMNNRRYRCTFCSRNFSTQTTLHNHLKAHFHSKIKLESIKNLDDDQEEASEIKP